MKKIFRWAFIGCGWIAERVANELVFSSAHKIVAVWNRTPYRAAEFATRYGATMYENLDEMLQSSAVDGVYIAVTANCHAEFMKSCIRYRKPVLCEKPFTVNQKEAREVLDYAQTEGVYVSEAMWTWHNDTAKFVKECITAGILGSIQEVQCYYSLPLVWTYPKKRLTSSVLVGGAVMDIGVYALRYCYELFGYPKNISCQGVVREGVDWSEEIILQYPKFEAKLSIAIDGGRGEQFLVFGEQGTLQVPDFHMAQTASIYGERCERFSASNKRMFLRQADQVVSEIRGEVGQKITTESTLAVMEMLDECRRQLGVVYPPEIGNKS